MKNRRKFGIIAALALLMGLLLVSEKANAQVMELGVTGGLSSYYGDLNRIKPFNEGRFGFGAVLRYYQGSRWAFRFSYSNLNITASDEKVGVCPERKLSFKTNLHDFSLVAEFNFLDYFTGSRRNFISPYLFAGVGFTLFNPMSLDGTELCNILTDVSEYDTTLYVNSTTGMTELEVHNKLKNGDAKYKRYSVSIPFGFGVKYSVNKRIGLALEWKVNWAWTDWLDDCSGYYPVWSDYGKDGYSNYADPSGNVNQTSVEEESKVNEVPFIQRGDSVKYDFYSFLNFTVAFKFNLPQSKKCNVGADRKYYTYY